MIFTHGYWIWYLILWSNVFCWGQIAIVVLTILRTHFTKKILLVPGVLAILTAIVHSYTLKSWRKTGVHRVLANYPQVIFSHTLAVINGCFAIAWFVVSIIMYIFATTLPRRRTPDADGVDLLYDIPPILFWLSAFAAYMLFTTAFALASTGLYYRHRFLKRSQRPVGYKPPRQLLTSSHTKWIMASIVLSLVACTLDLGVSLGDGWFGGYSLWLIPACTGITFFFQFITLFRWRKTAKQRWGTTTPLAISSITLPILLFPLASLWTATAIFSFLVAARKYSVRRYVFRASQYRRYTVFMYTRWIAAGLAMLVAVLIWLEFALVVYSRATYSKRLAHARQTTTGTTSSGGGGGGTGYEAHNNNNQVISLYEKGRTRDSDPTSFVSQRE
ncbi:hypothetical protein FS842_005628 [Serendipita sp. 407]|nr:hypothetical protein FS842_005628 [Serendipita sp. 407]